MSYTNILFEVKEQIAFITVNRPDKMNALSIDTISEIGNAFGKVYENDSIRGVIITGSGDKSFVAGADIVEFAEFKKDQAKKMSKAGHDIFNYIEDCPKPVIAAVNGFALGGGCELAMACHMRVASDKAKFGQPEISLGIIPGYGGTQRLTRLIGLGKSIELILTADMIRADEAHRLGLVNYVVVGDQLIEKCKEILQKIFTKSPIAVSKSIDCIVGSVRKEVDGFDLEIEEFSNCFETEDFKEGVSAFLNKRIAEFKGN